MNKKLVIFGMPVSAWLMVGGLVMAASGAGVGTILAGSITGEMPVTVSQALLVGVPYFPETDDPLFWMMGSNGWDSTTTALTYGLASDPVQGVTRETLTLHHDRPDRYIGIRNDEKTGFQAAAENEQGDRYLVQVCFKNASDQDLVAHLDMDIPNGLEVEIFGSDEESQSEFNVPAVGHGNNNVINVTRVGPSRWKFIVKAGAEYLGTVDGSLAANEDPWQDCIGIQVISDDTNPPGFYKLNATVKQIAY